MANYSSKDLRIDFDNSGGSLQNISNYVLEINDVEVEAILNNDAMAFGDTWFESLDTGLRKMAPVELKGFYDDAASPAPDAIFYNGGAAMSSVTRTFKVTWGGTKTTSVETFINKYRRTAKVGAFTFFSVTLQPTGAVTEA